MTTCIISLHKQTLEYLCILVDDYEITIYTSDKWLAGGVETVYLEMKADGLDTSGEFKAGKGLAQGRYINHSMQIQRKNMIFIIFKRQRTFFMFLFNNQITSSIMNLYTIFLSI